MQRCAPQSPIDRCPVKLETLAVLRWRLTTDMYKVAYTECVNVPEYEPSYRLRAVGGSRLLGHASLSEVDVQVALDRGIVPFRSRSVKRHVPYYTVLFGLAHPGIVYKNSPHNLSLAFRRVTLERENGTQLFINNRDAFTRGPSTTRRWRGVLWRHSLFISAHIRSIMDITEERDMMQRFAMIPHVKRQLRLRTLCELELTGYQGRPTYVQRVRGKVKTQEWAKTGKLPRIIWDLKVPASLLGFVVPYLKAALEVPYETPEGLVRFVPSVTNSILTSVFADLMYLHRNVSVVHSDDMCMGINCVDGRLLVNVDIKSCDASHGPMIFQYLQDCAGQGPFGHLVSILIDQLRAGLVLRNPHDPKEKFTYQCDDPLLYSGSTLTTVVNTIATMVISQRIFHDLYIIPRQQRTRVRVCQQITESALSCGYLVTCDVAHNAQQLLFLKHAPSTCGVPFLAIGTVLRSITRYDGDVPGSRRKTPRVRMEAHVRSVLVGHQHAGGHILTDALCDRFGLPKFHNRVDARDLCLRYGLDVWQLTQLADIIRNLPLGVIVRDDAMDRILLVDYGASLAP